MDYRTACKNPPAQSWLVAVPRVSEKNREKKKDFMGEMIRRKQELAIVHLFRRMFTEILRWH